MHQNELSKKIYKYTYTYKNGNIVLKLPMTKQQSWIVQKLDKKIFLNSSRWQLNRGIFNDYQVGRILCFTQQLSINHLSANQNSNPNIITQICNFQKFEKLQTIEISNNGIVSLQAIRYLYAPKLSRFLCRQNYLTNLKPLSRLPLKNLSMVYLEQNHIHSIDDFSEFDSQLLCWLQLEANRKLSSVSQLIKLKSVGLQHIYLQGCSISTNSQMIYLDYFQKKVVNALTHLISEFEEYVNANKSIKFVKIFANQQYLLTLFYSHQDCENYQLSLLRIGQQEYFPLDQSDFFFYPIFRSSDVSNQKISHYLILIPLPFFEPQNFSLNQILRRSSDSSSYYLFLFQSVASFSAVYSSSYRQGKEKLLSSVRAPIFMSLPKHGPKFFLEKMAFQGLIHVYLDFQVTEKIKDAFFLSCLQLFLYPKGYYQFNGVNPPTILLVYVLIRTRVSYASQTFDRNSGIDPLNQLALQRSLNFTNLGSIKLCRVLESSQFYMIADSNLKAIERRLQASLTKRGSVIYVFIFSIYFLLIADVYPLFLAYLKTIFIILPEILSSLLCEIKSANYI